MNEESGDPTPVVGGCEIPDYLLDTPEVSGQPPDDDLGRQIFHLVSLHPRLPARFRELKLAELDDAAKRAVLGEIQAILGIRELRSETLLSLGEQGQ